MTRWFALLAIALFAFAVASNAQITASWNYYPPEPPLTTTCGGATPIPDGTIVKIFWDQNGDGPDATDLQPPLCNDPPFCESQLPLGSVNFNQFPMNGSSSNGQAGTFSGESYMTTQGITPNPPRYYLRIFQPDGITPLWTSVVKTLVPGIQDINFIASEWVCGSGGPQCVVVNEQE
jgi:hypothetical protein